MISLYNQVPTVYLEASRDFQYLSWLFNIVLNSVKHNIDDMYELPKSVADSKLSELLAFTLGFKIKRNYDKDQLLALVNIIPNLLRYKGTEYAIILAGNALIKASGVAGECYIKSSEEDLKKGIINVLLPKTLIDISLFTDLLPYILPAGMSCRVSRKTVEVNVQKTIIKYDDVPKAEWHKDIEYNNENKRVIGLSGLFDTTVDNRIPNFTNYTLNSKGIKVLNAGLLSNTVIPVVADADILRDHDPNNELENNNNNNEN